MNRSSGGSHNNGLSGRNIFDEIIGSSNAGRFPMTDFMMRRQNMYSGPQTTPLPSSRNGTNANIFMNDAGIPMDPTSGRPIDVLPRININNNTTNTNAGPSRPPRNSYYTTDNDDASSLSDNIASGNKRPRYVDENGYAFPDGLSEFLESEGRNSDDNILGFSIGGSSDTSSRGRRGGRGGSTDRGRGRGRGGSVTGVVTIHVGRKYNTFTNDDQEMAEFNAAQAELNAEIEENERRVEEERQEFDDVEENNDDDTNSSTASSSSVIDHRRMSMIRSAPKKIAPKGIMGPIVEMISDPEGQRYFVCELCAEGCPLDENQQHQSNIKDMIVKYIYESVGDIPLDTIFEFAATEYNKLVYYPNLEKGIKGNLWTAQKIKSHFIGPTGRRGHVTDILFILESDIEIVDQQLNMVRMNSLRYSNNDDGRDCLDEASLKIYNMLTKNRQLFVEKLQKIKMLRMQTGGMKSTTHKLGAFLNTSIAKSHGTLEHYFSSAMTAANATTRDSRQNRAMMDALSKSKSNQPDGINRYVMSSYD